MSQTSATCLNFLKPFGPVVARRLFAWNPPPSLEHRSGADQSTGDLDGRAKRVRSRRPGALWTSALCCEQHVDLDTAPECLKRMRQTGKWTRLRMSGSKTSHCSLVVIEQAPPPRLKNSHRSRGKCGGSKLGATQGNFLLVCKYFPFPPTILTPELVAFFMTWPTDLTCT